MQSVVNHGNSCFYIMLQDKTKWTFINSAFIKGDKIVVCQAWDKHVGCTIKSQIDQYSLRNVHIKKIALSFKETLLLTLWRTQGNLENYFLGNFLS